MPGFTRVAAAGGGGLDLSSSNHTLGAVAGPVALLALGPAVVFRRQVVAAGDGAEKMRDIGGGGEEGARAYLRRQFTTLAGFVVLVLLLLFLLPGDPGVRVGRSLFFVVGAVFS